MQVLPKGGFFWLAFRFVSEHHVHILRALFGLSSEADLGFSGPITSEAVSSSLLNGHMSAGLRECVLSIFNSAFSGMAAHETGPGGRLRGRDATVQSPRDWQCQLEVPVRFLNHLVRFALSEHVSVKLIEAAKSRLGGSSERRLRGVLYSSCNFLGQVVGTVPTS